MGIKEYISLKNLSVKANGGWLEFKEGKIYKETEIPVENLADFKLADEENKNKYFKLNKEDIQANKILELEKENRNQRIEIESLNKKILELGNKGISEKKTVKTKNAVKDLEFEEIK